MFSSDKNVESLAQLIEVLKDYIGLQKEYLKFDVTEKFVRLIAALTLAVVTLVLIVTALFYLSFAAVYWMAPATGLATAFAIVGAFFAIMLAVVMVFRKPIIERPLIRAAASILLS